MKGNITVLHLDGIRQRIFDPHGVRQTAYYIGHRDLKSTQ